MNPTQANKEIKALNDFLTAYRNLNENFNNDTMETFYPFKESFDEIDIPNWINSAIELTNMLKIRELKNRFLTSKVKMTKEAIKQIYGYEISSDTAYIYLNGYYIEIYTDSFYVIYENVDKDFKTIEEAEDYFFNNFVKHQF